MSKVRRGLLWGLLAAGAGLLIWRQMEGQQSRAARGRAPVWSRTVETVEGWRPRTMRAASVATRGLIRTTRGLVSSTRGAVLQGAKAVRNR